MSISSSSPSPKTPGRGVDWNDQETQTLATLVRCYRMNHDKKDNDRLGANAWIKICDEYNKTSVGLQQPRTRHAIQLKWNKTKKNNTTEEEKKEFKHSSSSSSSSSGTYDLDVIDEQGHQWRIPAVPLSTPIAHIVASVMNPCRVNTTPVSFVNARITVELAPCHTKQ